MSILLAMLGGMVVLALLLLVASPFGRIAIGAVSVVGGLSFVAFLHYSVWGWWLGRIIREEEEDASDSESDG